MTVLDIPLYEPVRRIFMLDVLIVVVTIVFFVAMVYFTFGCERL
jgi:hypothetical protein